MKRAIVIRYGGFGDVLQAASILPGLKAQGFHVTWDADEKGFEILEHDPLIDALMLSPRGTVPGDKLADYWNARTHGFDRVINLCESVEVANLPLPVSLTFYHDDATRRRLFGSNNYLEHVHRIAGVNGPFVPRYVPTDAELKTASMKLARGINVTVALSGSSEYKIWPYVPEFVAGAIERGWNVFLAGAGALDEEIVEKIIDHVRSLRLSLDRVIDLTSKSVRESYAIAWLSDFVVGPETGLLNAVASTSGRKVVLLSHSSTRNLTEHWPNTMAVEPRVPCHPCHRLHKTTKFCPRGPSGQFAACAESIDPLHVLELCQTSEAS